MWEVLFDADFAAWFDGLDEGVQDSIFAHLGLLRRDGPRVGRPRVDSVKGSAFPNMKELRVASKGDPYRILFAFDPIRRAILLVGGNKKGDARWYKVNVPIADARFRRHLETLRD